MERGRNREGWHIVQEESMQVLSRLYLLTYAQLFLVICLPLTLLICWFICSLDDFTTLLRYRQTEQGLYTHAKKAKVT